ncbi:hypothetical protein J3R82DRAFT_6532 [Butyriboletus roseoflavus]|nr:hypothetical protein J3R82DRAFT_6532 [Butyriboletus roseoflavus]
MTAAPARGIGRQTDIQPAASLTPVSSQGDSGISSHPTPTSTHTTASQAPLTPQRGRSTTRYPESLSRVPLHRRGTSKTYECLEDLLREAGYKETRVFTPESDRNARSAAGNAGNSVRGSVGAVVDFFAGLVSRGSSLSHETAPLEDHPEQSASHAWSPPPSPLAHAIHIRDSRTKRVSSMASLSRNGSSENLRRRTYVDLSADAQLHQSSQGLPQHPHSSLGAHHHRHINRYHHQLNNNYSSKSSSSKPNPPNARAYLRHMVSAPNIQPLAKRTALSEASLRAHALGRDRRNGTRRTFILNDEDNIAESDYEPHSRATIDDHDHQVHPPLPRNWMESVAKALLSGVSGSAAVTSDAASTRTAKTASTRKSSTLSDKSNREERGTAPTRGRKPPLLCVQVQDVKARTSDGQVSCTRVMCRSTPTSRASSLARHSARDDHMKTGNGGKRRQEYKPRNRRNGKDRDVNVVPSLARTKVENDDWMAPRQRYSTGWGMESGAQAYPGGICLRKHLQRPQSKLLGHRGAPRPRSPRSGGTSPFDRAPTGRLDWGNASWSTSRGREWLTSQDEEGEDGYSHVFGSELAAGRSDTKWRRGLSWSRAMDDIPVSV